MTRTDKKMMRRRLANAYTSSIVSISLVLLLVGVATLLIVNARSVSDYIKESMHISVLMTQGTDQLDAEEYRNSVSTLPYVKSARVVSREEGTEELKTMLGEDFLSVFETSPVPISVEVALHAGYVSPDSLAMVSAMLSRFDNVDEVNCQQSLVEALNSNLTKISLILGIFILLMLFISFVLIGNTVRLNVFARRFTVHTMKLVGATKSFIRKPFLRASVWQGLVSAVLALAMIAGVLYFLKRSFVQLFELVDYKSMAIVGGVVVVTGILICVLSTYFVVGKLISMNKDELYY